MIPFSCARIAASPSGAYDLRLRVAFRYRITRMGRGRSRARSTKGDAMTTAGVNRQALGTLVQAVAAAVGNQPRCVEAVALLVALAQQFDIALHPRAVSMVGQDRRRSDRIVVTGRMAEEYVAANGGETANPVVTAAAPDGSEFQRAGHMVAVHLNPDFILDPSFGQFTRADLPDTVIATAFDPADSEWQVDMGEHVTALYLMDPTNAGWQDEYAAAIAASQGAAAKIAQHLRDGGLPDTHRVVLRPL